MNYYLQWLVWLVCILVFALPQICFATPKRKTVSVPDERSMKAVVKPSADSRRKVALVIGNGAYASSPLKNPVNDARAIATSLRRLGFDVDMRTNLGRIQMEEAVDKFGSRLASGGVGLFYYAGHGIQVAGNNYLVPVDAKINAESEVRYKAVDAGLVLSKMEQVKSDVNIVIMDACRDNPFGRSYRSASRGLANMDAPGGTIIAYSTAPGKTAADGDGANGLYTSELLKVMEMPGLNLEGVFKQVRKSVMGRTSGQQTPWESSSLTGEFRFISPSAETANPKPGRAPELSTPLPPASDSLDDIIERAEAEERAKSAYLEQVRGDFAKYEKIVASPRGAELKLAAWKALIAKYPVAAPVPAYDTQKFLASLGLAVENGRFVTLEQKRKKEEEIRRQQEVERLRRESAARRPGQIPGDMSRYQVPDMLTFKKGVLFNHKTHGTMTCYTCHASGTAKIAGFGKDFGHNYCKKCHAENRRGPTSCKDCHKM